MPYRVAEIVIPKQKKEEVEKLFNIDGVVDFWREELFENKSIYKVLVKTEFSQKLVDKLFKKFGKEEGFRIVLYDITATIPVSEEEEKKKKQSKIGKLRISREELYTNISSAAELNYIYLSLVILSSIIAVTGLITNNTAVIIGAMVIAPLLGPNIAIALATVLGDIELERKAFFTFLVGAVIAYIFAVSVGFIFPVDPFVNEINRRIYVSFWDIVVAMASGIAGVLAFTTGAALSLVGVMVAISLLPPLVTSGLLLGSGYLFYALGSMLLFLANFASLNLAGVLTFTLQGIRPMKWWEAKKAQSYRRKAMFLWTVLLVILAFVIFVENKYLK
ncbi:MAG: TIGR00341 family protein [Aquificae bacterium]|nr:TIGR00341 family protein [Aquificota bacterium]